jgi:hypothetical protein
MAHFAKIENGIVREVIVIDDADCGGGNYPESEAIGQAFIAQIGIEGQFLQTNENGEFRSVYAGIRSIYDPVLDVFMPPTTEEIPNV